MADEEAVLFANEAFYQAFANRDASEMDEVWARESVVTCIHPGWDSLTDRQSVMESWTAILGNPNSPAIRCRDPEVYFVGTAAFVICLELIGQECLIATNIFAREQGVWKMVHHQAGPTTATPQDDEPDETPSGMVH